MTAARLVSEYAGASGALSSDEEEDDVDIGFESTPLATPLGGLRVPLRASSLALDSAKAVSVPPNCRHSCVLMKQRESRSHSSAVSARVCDRCTPLASVVGVMTIPGSENSVGTNIELGSILRLPTVPLRLEALLLALLTSSIYTGGERSPPGDTVVPFEPQPPTYPLGPVPLCVELRALIPNPGPGENKD